MQISRFCEKSTTYSVDGHAETLHWLLLEVLVLTTSVPVRPSERKVRRKDNMSTKSFMQCKGTKKSDATRIILAEQFLRKKNFDENPDTFSFAISDIAAGKCLLCQYNILWTGSLGSAVKLCVYA